MFPPFRPPRVIESDPQLLEPLTQLVRVYDRAIGACEARDARGALAAIRLLREALELSSAASRSFDGLYAWCESAIGYGDFLGAARCLGTLREAWYRVVRPVSTHGRWPGRPVS